MNELFLILLAFGAAADGEAVSLSAEGVLARTLAHHDPQATWSSRPLELRAEVRLTEKLAAERGYARRSDRIRIDVSAGTFWYSSDKGSDRIEISASGETLTARLNGSWDISDADRAKHRLKPGDLPGWRDAMTYMYGLPMKLRDPGTRLDPEVARTELAGREVLALRVTYAPEVGTDTWYFYVDPATFALVGCRFYHDEAANDGEYLVFEGEVQGPNGLRLPKIRRWYVNNDGLHIATDDLLSIE